MRVNREGLRKLVTINLELRDEDMPYEGNAGDQEAETWIRDQLEAGNGWAWCAVKVSVSYGVLEGTDYVGGCSYQSRKDFEQSDLYHEMVDEALDDLAGQLETLVNEHGLWEHDETTCFWCIAGP